jgi:hypothetical protein
MTSTTTTSSSWTRFSWAVEELADMKAVVEAADTNTVAAAELEEADIVDNQGDQDQDN